MSDFDYREWQLTNPPIEAAQDMRADPDDFITIDWTPPLCGMSEDEKQERRDELAAALRKFDRMHDRMF
jgi:hypothetical protein